MNFSNDAGHDGCRLNSSWQVGLRREQPVIGRRQDQEILTVIWQKTVFRGRDYSSRIGFFSCVWLLREKFGREDQGIESDLLIISRLK